MTGMLGRTLNGTYRVSELVGSGGFADVYLGRDVRSNTVVAIKVLHDNFAEDPALVRRFFREAELAQSLINPHIVRVLDAKQDGDVYYLVMEYVQGLTLAQIIQQRGPVPIAEAVDFVSQVLEALAVAHRANIVHRDIKPQNLMVTPAGLVKVMDFGIAKRTAVETVAQTTMYVGTPRYMSPEQAKGGRATPQSDLYAVTITLYELIAGKTPFSAETPWQMLNLHMLAEAPPIRVYCSDVPPALEMVIARGLKKDPAQRFQSAEEMQQALREAVPGTGEPDGSRSRSVEDATLPAKELPMRRDGHAAAAAGGERDERRGAAGEATSPVPVASVAVAKRPASWLKTAGLVAAGAVGLFLVLVVIGILTEPAPAPTPAPTFAPRPTLPPAVATPTLMPTPLPTPPPTATPGLLPNQVYLTQVAATPSSSVAQILSSIYVDAFSDPSSGFPPRVAQPGSYDMEYGDKQYDINLLRAGTTDHGVAELALNPKRRFSDFSLLIMAHLAQATQRGAYAVVFRAQDQRNFYAFAVDPNVGKYTVYKAVNGTLMPLVVPGGTQVQGVGANGTPTPVITWTSSAAIKPGTSVNALGVAASGHTLGFSVNGTMLTSVQDSTFAGGNIGLEAEAWGQPVSAIFTGLLVTPPKS